MSSTISVGSRPSLSVRASPLQEAMERETYPIYKGSVWQVLPDVSNDMDESRIKISALIDGTPLVYEARLKSLKTAKIFAQVLMRETPAEPSCQLTFKDMQFKFCNMSITDDTSQAELFFEFLSKESKNAFKRFCDVSSLLEEKGFVEKEVTEEDESKPTITYVHPCKSGMNQLQAKFREVKAKIGRATSATLKECDQGLIAKLTVDAGIVRLCPASPAPKSSEDKYSAMSWSSASSQVAPLPTTSIPNSPLLPSPSESLCCSPLQPLSTRSTSEGVR